MVNAAGGVNGRKIELRSLDDGYEPDRAARQYEKLIDERRLPAVRLRRHADIQRRRSRSSPPRSVPFVGPFTGARIAAQSAQPLHLQRSARATSTETEQDRRTDSTGQTLDHASPCSTRTTTTARAGLGGCRARDAKAQHEDRPQPARSERNTTDVAGGSRGASARPIRRAVVMISAYKSVRRVHQGRCAQPARTRSS